MSEKLFIISGPSCAGEDSIIKGLENYFPIERVVTTTTRERRPGEIDGIDYYFISKEKFREKLESNEFFEYAEQYNGNFYGVTFAEIGRVKSSARVGIWKIEYKGVISAKKVMPDIKAIFINAPLEVLAARMRRRDYATDEYIEERMAYTREWLKHTDIYDYTVVNEEGKLLDAVAEVASIINSVQ